MRFGERCSFSNYFHSFYEKIFLPHLQKFFFADLFRTLDETLILQHGLASGSSE